MIKRERYEIRFSGSGGQGIIMAAVVVAEAAGIYENKFVCQSQSYGPQARGGKSKSEVIISTHPIDYPKVTKMDLFLAMNQESCDAYFFNFKPNGILIVDSTLVKQLPTSRVIALPFTHIARDEIGKTMVANMVALGAISHFCPEVSFASIKKSVLNRVPPGTEKMNKQALMAGLQIAESFNLSSLPRSISPEEHEI